MNTFPLREKTIRERSRVRENLQSVGDRLSQIFSHELRRHNTVVARLARHLELGGSQLQNELHSQLRDQHNCGSQFLHLAEQSAESSRSLLSYRATNEASVEGTGGGQ